MDLEHQSNNQNKKKKYDLSQHEPKPLLKESTKQFLKMTCYAGLMSTIVMGGILVAASWAHLDDQVDKATTLVLGKVAPLVLGGATLFGGGSAILAGKVYPGLAIVGVGAITGIGIALAKSGTIFNLLQ